MTGPGDALPSEVSLEKEIREKLSVFLAELSLPEYLAQIVLDNSHLEFVSYTGDGDVVFRYVDPRLGSYDLDGVNRMILYELWKFEYKMIHEESLNGCLMLRASDLRDHCTYKDLDIMVEQISNIGDILLREYL